MPSIQARHEQRVPKRAAPAAALPRREVQVLRLERRQHDAPLRPCAPDARAVARGVAHAARRGPTVSSRQQVEGRRGGRTRTAGRQPASRAAQALAARPSARPGSPTLSLEFPHPPCGSPADTATISRSQRQAGDRHPTRVLRTRTTKPPAPGGVSASCQATFTASV